MTSLFAPRRRQGSKLLKVAAIGTSAAVLAGAGAFVYAAAVEPYRVEVRHVELHLPRLPEQFRGYRLVQISDIHAGRWMPDNRLHKIVDIVNEQQPDLIAITGDFVTRVYRDAVIDIVPPLSRLRAKDGVAAVLGNHDYWGRRGPDAIRRIIRDCGMIDLNNKVHTLQRDGAFLHLAGVDSARVRKARLDAVLAKLPEEGAAILLAHEPDFARVSARTGRFDLQLSGHSHGGQVVIPFIGSPNLPPLARRYHTGLYKVRDMYLYTNRGLGMVGLPMRFLSRPEITVFTLS